MAACSSADFQPMAPLVELLRGKTKQEICKLMVTVMPIMVAPSNVKKDKLIEELADYARSSGTIADVCRTALGGYTKSYIHLLIRQYDPRAASKMPKSAMIDKFIELNMPTADHAADYARELLMQGRVISTPRSELGQWFDVVAHAKPKLYLDCRQWLEWYADTHAEQNPISLQSYLPRGRKQFYWRMIYEDDRNKADRQAASLPAFLAAWRCETPWIVIPKRIGRFLKCGMCLATNPG